jgi:hypothetical protein
VPEGTVQASETRSLAITHVHTPTEARQAVRGLTAAGVDFIKVPNALPPDAFFALMDEAREEHIPPRR